MRETHRLPESISGMLGGALARTMGHGEHSLSPDRAVERNRGRMKSHHTFQAHVRRPFEGLIRIGNTVAHGNMHDP